MAQSAIGRRAEGLVRCLYGAFFERAVIFETETFVAQKHALSSASVAQRKRLGLWRLWNM